MTAPDSEWMERTEADLAEIVDGLRRLKDEVRGGPVVDELRAMAEAQDISCVHKRPYYECGACGA